MLDGLRIARVTNVEQADEQRRTDDDKTVDQHQQQIGLQATLLERRSERQPELTLHAGCFVAPLAGERRDGFPVSLQRRHR